MGSKTEEEEVKSSIRVGKLEKKVYELKSDEVKNTASEVRVGKINTENLFQRAEENSEELLSICKPGKLSEDKLILSSNLDDSKEEGRNDDLDIVPSGKVSERTSVFESKPETSGSPKLSPGPVLKRSESNLTSDMQKKYQQQVARNQSLRREKSDVVVVSVQDGKITDAKNSFMQSMMTSSGSSSSSRLGTSILPAGLDGQVILKQEQSSSSSVVHKTSSKKGKDLFRKCAERQEQNVESSMSSTFTTQESVSSLIPGVDFEEIEDEFEKLHREMMKDGGNL